MDKKLTARNFQSGIEDFEELITKDLAYIDKTAQLDDLVHRAKVMLLLRPRRFGKTLTMSMLSCFLEMNYQNPEDRSRPKRLFKGLKVSENRAFCEKHMGRYPVISISFKDVAGSTLEDAVRSIITVFAEQSDRFSFLIGWEGLSTRFLERISDLDESEKSLMTRDGNIRSSVKNLIVFFIRKLSALLKKAFNKKAIILIDEYDVPLQKAKSGGYYDKMLEIIRGIMGAALKTNSSLEKGFVTGCLRIAHQSIFTGINNFKTCGIQDEFLSDFIGLTREETARLLEECKLKSRLSDVTKWYDGYNFAENDMLCPWSVLNFTGDALDSKNPEAFKPQNYWANSSGNDIIGLVMRHPGGRDLERLQNLMEGKTEEIALREFTTYPEITSDTDFDTFATLMLHTGYLTVVKDAVPPESNKSVVRIPNNEILECFSEKAKTIFSSSNPEWVEQAFMMLDALFAGDVKKVQDIINDMLMRFISNRDAMSGEGYYHGFMTSVLGIAAESAGSAGNRVNRVKMESEKDDGNGFSDIVLSKVFEGKAVILEFKKCKSGTPKSFKDMCTKALNQIEDKKYDYRYRASGYQEVLKYGIAFYGKECLVLKMPDDPAVK